MIIKFEDFSKLQLIQLEKQNQCEKKFDNINVCGFFIKSIVNLNQKIVKNIFPTSILRKHTHTHKQIQKILRKKFAVKWFIVYFCTFFSLTHLHYHHHLPPYRFVQQRISFHFIFIFQVQFFRPFLCQDFNFCCY